VFDGAETPRNPRACLPHGDQAGHFLLLGGRLEPAIPTEAIRDFQQLLQKVRPLVCIRVRRDMNTLRTKLAARRTEAGRAARRWLAGGSERQPEAGTVEFWRQSASNVIPDCSMSWSGFRRAGEDTQTGTFLVGILTAVEEVFTRFQPETGGKFFAGNRREFFTGEAGRICKSVRTTGMEIHFGKDQDVLQGHGSARSGHSKREAE
jgi:hypothetical protein